jgi:hypothetical protein
MKPRIFAASLLAAVLCAFALTGAIAQSNPQSSQGQTNQSQTESRPMGRGMMEQSQSRMGQGMMGQRGVTDTMGQMMQNHRHVMALMNKLMANIETMQSENAPAAMRQHLAQQKALLEQMHSQMMQQQKRMRVMVGQRAQNCTGAATGISPAK